MILSDLDKVVVNRTLVSSKLLVRPKGNALATLQIIAYKVIRCQLLYALNCVPARLGCRRGLIENIYTSAAGS